MSSIAEFLIEKGNFTLENIVNPLKKQYSLLPEIYVKPINTSFTSCSIYNSAGVEIYENCKVTKQFDTINNMFRYEVDIKKSDHIFCYVGFVNGKLVLDHKKNQTHLLIKCGLSGVYYKEYNYSTIQEFNITN